MQTFFVLVEPQYPENVGSVARAMKTMGFEHLILVNPCDYKSDPASWLAVGSEDILNNASVFEHFDEAVYDMDFIIGTSSKKRQVKFDYYEAEKIPVMIREKGNSIHSVALVFGREDYGLPNSVLAKCDVVSTIPLHTVYPSLNLAQSVMLFAYIVARENISVIKDEQDQNNQGYKVLKDKVASLLEKSGILKNSNKYNRIFERLAILGEEDINLVHSICNALNSKC